jgi:predicted AAA+ superfamily ATPase
MIGRLIAPKLEKAPKTILLLGPRQTGKSTLLRSLSPDLSIDLARESEFLDHSTDASLLESLLEAQKPETVFIDEIQRIPALLNTIQALLDEAKARGKKLKFLLSGSSARKLRRGQANLLPGRIFSFHLGGLCAAELGNRLNIDKALRFGFLPEPCLEPDEEICAKLLSTYAAVYLKEEIQAESLTRNIAGFARFLNEIAMSSGDILDFSKVATKAKLSRSSCVRFVEILEDTLLAERIPVFSEGHEADVIKHPKLYFFDIGVLNGLLGNFTASPDRRGRLFEHLVYSQIRNSSMALDRPYEIFYFRTRNGIEVDFVVKHAGKVWAIEAKSGTIQDHDLKGLNGFREYFPKVEACIAVGPKERLRKKNGTLICGIKDMLEAIGLG